jgi:hypothetical protein
MKNPNVYGGNDPVQMEANNTSAFNCRQAVGNPYKLSPHSHGTSIDVNPVQNPYRDVNANGGPITACLTSTAVPFVPEC